MLIKIRTNDELVKLLKEGISYAWRISKGRINSITDVEIYDFSGKAKIVGIFDKEKTKILENGRVAIAFKDAKIEQTNYKWVGQNPIKYELAGVEEDENSSDESEHSETVKSKGKVKKEKSVLVDKGDIKTSINKESDCKKLSVFGFGRELIIGTLDEEEVDELVGLEEDDEDYPDRIDEILGDITKRDDVFHFWGADMEDIDIKDSAGNKFDFKVINLNMEPTFDFKDSLDYRFEMLADDACEALDLDIDNLKNKDWNSIFSSLSRLFSENPDSEIFIIASNVEKGHFGDIVVPADTPNENILLVSLTLEGMSITTEMLVGYLVYDNGTFIFNDINIEEVNTETKQSFIGYLWDNSEGNTLWEGAIN